MIVKNEHLPVEVVVGAVATMRNNLEMYICFFVDVLTLIYCSLAC
jgi:hypothetical protein